MWIIFEYTHDNKFFCCRSRISSTLIYVESSSQDTITLNYKLLKYPELSTTLDVWTAEYARILRFTNSDDMRANEMYKFILPFFLFFFFSYSLNDMERAHSPPRRKILCPICGFEIITDSVGAMFYVFRHFAVHGQHLPINNNPKTSKPWWNQSNNKQIINDSFQSQLKH